MHPKLRHARPERDRLAVKPLRITHLSAVFIALIGGMAISLAAYMMHELNGITGSMQAWERAAAAEEVRRALQSTVLEARRITANLAQRDETRQHLAYDAYSKLWRNTRIKDAGMVPETVASVALYNKAGSLLSADPDNAMPARVPAGERPLSLFKQGTPAEPGQEYVVFFHPVHADPAGQVRLGYVGLKFDLRGELERTRLFRFADIKAIQTLGGDSRLDDFSELERAVQYEVRPNPSLQLVKDLFRKELFQLLLFVVLILSAATYLLHRLMIRPLLAISHEMDALHDTSARLDKPLNPATAMPVMELENVRRSFYNYHSRLAELHQHLERSSQDFYDQARRDALTGTYNRRAFEEDWQTTQAMQDCQQCALLLFDCDHFKAINDTYGHGVGDEVIKAVSACLESALRIEDRLYRLGGDEFATVLPYADAAKAKTIAERCQEHVLAQDFRQYGMAEPLSISIGIAAMEHQPKGLSLSELQRRADLAMYAAKRPGSSKIVFYHDDLGEVASLVANRAVSAVYAAIQDPQRLELHYHPIMRLPEQALEYVEALARIRLDDALLSPDEILPIVHTRRLDAEFDLAVLRALERDMRSGRLPPGQGVSVNISAPGIVHTKVLDALLAMRQAEKARKVVIEISETALITQMDAAGAHVRQLRNAGCLVALDDFGSGYSSLRYLSAMPVDLVKFDACMTRLLEQAEPQHNRITSEIAALVKNAGYRIVAEGIEDQATLDRINQIGFHYGQGYFFGRPA